jgi:nucleoside-diphosphate-sugar epimerase
MTDDRPRGAGGAGIDLPAAPAAVLTGAGARRLLGSQVRVVVVGAGGWLGLATLELLSDLLGSTFGDRVLAFGSSPRWLSLRSGLTVRQGGLADLAGLRPEPTLLLHLAYLTQERAKTMSDGDYALANRTITDQVMASLDRIGVVGVFLPSSGAVYQTSDAHVAASVRLYGRLKLEDEARLRQWAGSPGRRAVIARVFNLSGAYINKLSSYALACFIADGLAHRPIAVKATRPVYRSYVAVSELMSVVFGALTDGQSGANLFDTAGDVVLEMGEIATAVSETCASGCSVARPPIASSQADRYVGDGAEYRRLREMFGVEPISFPAQILHTARYLAEANEGHRVTGS